MKGIPPIIALLFVAVAAEATAQEGDGTPPAEPTSVASRAPEVGGAGEARNPDETPDEIPGETPDEIPAGTETAAPVDPWADTHLDTSAGRAAAPEEARGWAREPGVQTEDVVLFVPRALLFLPKLAVEVVFAPILWSLEAIEREKVIEHVEEVLYWNEEHTAGFYPALSYESRFGFSYGATVFHDDLFGHDERLHGSARYGGRFSQAYELTFGGARVGGTRLFVEALARYERNPGLVFGGLGVGRGDEPPPTPQDARAFAVETRYRQERLLGHLALGYTHGTTGSMLHVGPYATMNVRAFGASAVDEASIETVYDTSTVPGFEDGATTMELGLSLVSDARSSPGMTATGARLEVFGGWVPPVDGWSFGHYGAELEWVIELWGGDRLLALRAAVEATHGDVGDIPFTALPRLGGPERGRGYVAGQFRDRRMALGSVEYRYPIHRHLLGVLFVDAGTVAPSWPKVFDAADEWKLGGGGGLLAGGARGVVLRLDVSYGDGFHLFVSTDVARAFDGRDTEP